MKQQSTPQRSTATTFAGSPRDRKSVSMGMGVITPAVREHLGKAAKLGREGAKPQQTPTGR